MYVQDFGRINSVDTARVELLVKVSTTGVCDRGCNFGQRCTIGGSGCCVSGVTSVCGACTVGECWCGVSSGCSVGESRCGVRSGCSVGERRCGVGQRCCDLSYSWCSVRSRCVGLSVGQGSGDLGVRSGCSVCSGCSVRSRCSVGKWRSVNGLDGDWCSSDGLDGELSWFLAYDCVESVYGIGGVLDDTTRTVGLDERVATLNEITVAALLLRLEVTGDRVLDIVRVTVLGMRVEIGIHRLRNYGLGYWCCVGKRSCSVRCWSRQETSVRHCYQSEETYELE